MEIKIKNQYKTVVTLEVTGDINISNTKLLLDTYLEVFQKKSKININTFGSINIDTSGLQILHSIKQHAKEAKKKVSLNISITDETKQLLAITGLDQILE